MNFEKKLTRLEEIVEKMEGGEMALEDSLKIFEEGVKLSRDCHQELSAAEQKVQTLVGVDSDGQPIMENFPQGDN